MTTPPHARNRQGRRGFTLIELIAVMAIMVILASVSIPALSALMDNMNVAGGGQIVSSQLNLARQIAASRNCDVEVRLLQAPGKTYYNGIQLWAIVPPSTTTAPVSRLMMLPVGAVISSSLSPPLLPGGSYITSMGSGTMPEGTFSTVNYVSFRLSPEGLSTPYLPMTSFYLTVVSLSSANKTTAPSNFVAVQVNSSTGNPLVYRP